MLLIKDRLIILHTKLIILHTTKDTNWKKKKTLTDALYLPKYRPLLYIFSLENKTPSLISH